MAQVRKAGKQWRENAPDYVVDCFYQPKYTDCYTVMVLNGDGSLSYLGTSPSLGFSGWNDIEKHHAREFRYGHGKSRIRWVDVPEIIRKAVIAGMEGVQA